MIGVSTMPIISSTLSSPVTLAMDLSQTDSVFLMSLANLSLVSLAANLGMLSLLIGKLKSDRIKLISVDLFISSYTPSF